MTEQKPLIILTGPTAVGKTELSVRLAQAAGAEIISADSMQVYKHMDIGTAKIRPEQMCGVRHYLVDCLEPSEPFNVVKFQQLAKQAIREIYSHGRIPMIVGGTGFYIQSVLYDIDFTLDNEEEYRERFYALAREKGPEYLHAQLAAVDPEAAGRIHHNNVKRVARALEYYYQTGTPISEHNECQREKTSPYRFVYFVLNDERSRLYERINRRVDEMFSQGFEEEMRGLLAAGLKPGMTSMQGIGYKELFGYFDGSYSLERAKELISQHTRNFAKRQITWFKREKSVIWINYADHHDSQDEMLEAMISQIREKGII